MRGGNSPGKTISPWPPPVDEDPGSPPNGMQSTNPIWSIRVYLWPYRPNPSFSPNRALNQILVKNVLEESGLNGESRVLDLYSGAGNFSCSLAFKSQNTSSGSRKTLTPSPTPGSTRRKTGSATWIFFAEPPKDSRKKKSSRNSAARGPTSSCSTRPEKARSTPCP